MKELPVFSRLFCFRTTASTEEMGCNEEIGKTGKCCKGDRREKTVVIKMEKRKVTGELWENQSIVIHRIRVKVRPSKNPAFIT